MGENRRNLMIERAIAAGGGSQAELARRCGCQQQHISKLLNGDAPVTPRIAVAIARATEGQVRIADLLPEFVEAVAAELGVPPSHAMRHLDGAAAC